MHIPAGTQCEIHYVEGFSYHKQISGCSDVLM